jgi:transcriptional regulator with XRE-family HTH domain
MVNDSNFKSVFAQRLYTLRTEHNISAREMSLAIGQNSSYINRIENKITLPSMQGFFYICDYLKITPQEFFDTGIKFPNTLRTTIDMLNQLDHQELEAINHLLMVMIQNKKPTVK